MGVGGQRRPASAPNARTSRMGLTKAPPSLAARELILRLVRARQTVIILLRKRTKMLAIHRTLVLVALLGFPSVSIWAADCGSKQQIIDSLRARIKADQNAIRQLNPRITADELDKWAAATEAERQDILKRSIESTLSVLLDGLVDKVLSAPETALKSWNIAGYHLPN